MALLSCIIADIWLATPFMMLVLLAGLQSMPKEFIEAARIDGASSLQAFIRVTLPILSPVVAVVIVIRMIDAFKTFDIVWMLTQGGPEFASEVVSTNIYRELMRYFNVGLSSAMSLVFLLVLMAISVGFFFRIWKKGR
jgi:multiple sugar transport system permease protein